MTFEDCITMNRREYTRVYAYIPMAYRLISKDEHAVVRSQISGNMAIPDYSMLPEVEEPLLNEWLRVINTKLDSLIRLITLQGEGFQSLPFKAVHISGNGMNFTTKDPFQSGDILEIKVVLSSGQSAGLYLYLYGEVVKTEKQTSGYVTVLSYIKIDDKIRDEIVRFVFEKEREILREKRK
ncbi:MAG: PilZ domain-containing protein [Syntrophus sp. (in: bacteria)]